MGKVLGRGAGKIAVREGVVAYGVPAASQLRNLSARHRGPLLRRRRPASLNGEAFHKEVLCRTALELGKSGIDEKQAAQAERLKNGSGNREVAREPVVEGEQNCGFVREFLRAG